MAIEKIDNRKTEMKKIFIFLLFAATASGAIFLNSFNSGLISEELKVRHDLDRTHMGSEELDNILIRPQGMAYKRPGTEYIAERLCKYIPEVPEVPAVPPAPIRDEAFAICANTVIDFLDSEYNFLESVVIDSSSCREVTVSVDGVVVTGGASSTYPIMRIDADMNSDNDYYSPDGGWGFTYLLNTTNGVVFSSDGAYLYALITDVGVSSLSHLFKFDDSDGSQVWRAQILALGNCLALDDDGYIYTYTGGYKGIIKFDPDSGSQVDTYPHTPYISQRHTRDIHVDDDMGVVIVTGNASSGRPQMTIFQLDGSLDTEITFENSADLIYSVTTKGDYIYCCGNRMNMGAYNAAVFKLESDGTIVDYYDTGYHSTFLWLDHDENINVRGLYSEDTNIHVFDDDLTLLSSHAYAGVSVTGMAGEIIPYMDAGTPAVPAVPGYWSIGTGPTGAIRLIPFEHSTNDAYVLEFGHKYIGFLRTVQ